MYQPDRSVCAVDEVLTGRENLILIARLRHLKNPGKTADNLLSHFELTEAGSRRVRTYSGGMRRRLDISMSLIGDPQILFLDEPTTGLAQKRESAYGRKSNSFPKMAKPYSLPHSIWRKQNSWPITLPFSTRERLSQMALLQN